MAFDEFFKSIPFGWRGKKFDRDYLRLYRIGIQKIVVAGGGIPHNGSPFQLNRGVFVFVQYPGFVYYQFRFIQYMPVFLFCNHFECLLPDTRRSRVRKKEGGDYHDDNGDDQKGFKIAQVLDTGLMQEEGYA